MGGARVIGNIILESCHGVQTSESKGRSEKTDCRVYFAIFCIIRYILQCEGAFLEIVNEKESACGWGGSEGSWHGAKCRHINWQSAKSHGRNLALCQVT